MVSSDQVLVEAFRERLRRVIDRSGLSLTGFAKKVGIDRSTLSQILSPNTWRLPRIETLTSIAASEQVSIDWLVGLSEEGALGPDILPLSVEIAGGGTSPADEQLQSWRREALGYKIRYVPSTLPDLLKTETIIDYEYRRASTATPEQRQTSTQERLAYQRRPETDMEVVSTHQSLRGFAHGQGLWSNLPIEARREQLQHIRSLVDELYPTFRWFLYDALQLYSVPLTVFGPKRAVIYLGQKYMVINSRELIQALVTHFDELIRNAVIQPIAITSYVDELLAEIA